MRALLVTPRLPGTGYTGDRVRAQVHLEALSAAGFEVTTVGGVREGGSPVRLPTVALPLTLARAAAAGEPLQSGFFAGAWADALASAGGATDLVVVLLPQRLWPHVAASLPSAPLVLDYVDALAEAARQASGSDPSAWRRGYWAMEAPRLERIEREAARRATALLATTAFDASHLPFGTVAVPNGVAIGPSPPAGLRAPIVAFAGRLRYRPNRLALRRLLKSIWPLVRRQVPEASLVVGGADAPPELLAAAGRNGVQVESPVLDMPAFLRKARVVAAPVALGTGTPNKLFEAFEAGTAVVATPEVVARATLSAAVPPARAGRDDEELASHLVAYLRDPDAAAADGARGRAFVEDHADRRQIVQTLGALYRRALGPGS